MLRIRREGPIPMGRDKQKRQVRWRQGEPPRVLAPRGGLGGQAPPVLSPRGGGVRGGGAQTEEMGSEIRFAADYVEALDVRGSKFAHACPGCVVWVRRKGGRSPRRWRIAKRGPVAPFVGDRVPRCLFCKRELVQVGGRKEGLFGRLGQA